MDDGIEVSEIDRAIAVALDVDVSPDFASRVRQRIAAEPMRTPFWRGWRPVAVPAVAAVAMIVAVRVATVPTRQEQAAHVLAARAIVVPPVQPTAAAPSSRPRTSVGVARSPRPAVAVTTSARGSTEPEVLVPRVEIEMYRRLIAAAQQASPHAEVVTAPVDTSASRGTSDIKIDPIHIEPISPPASGEGDRQ